MRISDWSSDVCSSDLDVADRPGGQAHRCAQHHSDHGHWHQPDAQEHRDAPAEAQLQVVADQPDEPRRGTELAHLGDDVERGDGEQERSEEHTSELQSLMRISYAVFCLKNKKKLK